MNNTYAEYDDITMVIEGGYLVVLSVCDSDLCGFNWKPLVSKRENKVRVHALGCFDSAKDAYDAYCEAAKRLHGEFFNPGS